MNLDLLPPRRPYQAVFGKAGTLTVPGGTPVAFLGYWQPSRIEQFPISDSAVTDIMHVLAIPLFMVGHWVPEGSRVVIPPMGQTVAETYTVRKVYDRDAEYIIVGLAA